MSRGSTPRTRPSKARSPLKAAATAAFFLLRRHPSQVLAAIVCSAMAGSIIGNAILFQSGRHPAPLFGHQTAQGGDQTAAAIPIPASRPLSDAQQAARPTEAAPDDRIPETNTAAPAPKVAANGPSPVHAPGAKVPAHKQDAIAQLLRGVDGKTPGSEPEADTRVAAAQRSLEKLGFSVKPDGRMGNSTRAALEKFERDHHLTLGLELSPKLLRELAAAAGLPPG